MRQPGYYWVKHEGEWTIGLWRRERYESMSDSKTPIWKIPEYDSVYFDSDFEEIDERRIERKESLPERPRTDTTTTQDRY